MQVFLFLFPSFHYHQAIFDKSYQCYSAFILVFQFFLLIIDQFLVFLFTTSQALGRQMDLLFPSSSSFILLFPPELIYSLHHRPRLVRSVNKYIYFWLILEFHSDYSRFARLIQIKEKVPYLVSLAIFFSFLFPPLIPCEIYACALEAFFAVHQGDRLAQYLQIFIYVQLFIATILSLIIISSPQQNHSFM